MSARAAPRSLLGRATAAVFAAYGLVLLARFAVAGRIEPAWLLPLVGLAALLLLLRLLLALGRFRGDPVLLAAGLFLAGLGVVLQVRLGTLDPAAPLRGSSLAFPLGLACLAAVALLLRGGRLRALTGVHTLAGLATLLVLGGVLLAGRRFRGGVFLEGNINPTEVVKVLLVVYLAGLFTAYRKAFERPLLPGLPTLQPGLLLSLACCWLPAMVLLVLLRDLGMMVLLNAVLLVMAVSAGGRWSFLVTGLAGAGAAGAGLIAVMPHGSSRVAVWLDPFADATGKGWQVLQGLSAMASGGLWGAGLGAGHPTVIPIAASDFVYAALAEELGYVGCALVLAVYLLMFYRGFRLADSLREPFTQSLATGLTAALAVQTLLNLGGVTKAIPLTGITLPFLSHGGSSLVVSFIMLGLLLALSDPGKR